MRPTSLRCAAWLTSSSENRLPRMFGSANGIVIGWPVLPGMPGLLVSRRQSPECPLRSTNRASRLYTHLSDRYSPFYTKLIAATASEALHVLDALLYHHSEVAQRGDTIPMVAVIPTASFRAMHRWSACSSRLVSRT